MPAYFLKQPNGRLARFSTIVDGFTHLDMTREEAFEVARGKGFSESEASAAIERALADQVAYYDEGMPRREDGLTRWQYCLEVLQRRDEAEHAEAVKLGTLRLEES